MSAPIRARLGPAIEAQLAKASPNTSAALRAFVLLGFAAAGVDMGPLQREIARALADDLAPEVLAALRAIEERRTGVGQVSYDRPTPTGEVVPSLADNMEADPLLSVGIEV